MREWGGGGGKKPLLLFSHSFQLLFLSIWKSLVIDSAWNIAIL